MISDHILSAGLTAVMTKDEILKHAEVVTGDDGELVYLWDDQVVGKIPAEKILS